MRKKTVEHCSTCHCYTLHVDGVCEWTKYLHPDTAALNEMMVRIYKENTWWMKMTAHDDTAPAPKRARSKKKVSIPMKHIDPKALQGRPLVEPEETDEATPIIVRNLDEVFPIIIVSRKPNLVGEPPNLGVNPPLPPVADKKGDGRPEKPWRMQKEHLCLLFCATAACFTSEKTLVRMGGLAFFAASMIGVSSLYQ